MKAGYPHAHPLITSSQPTVKFSVGMQLTGSPVRAGSSLLNEANHIDPKTIPVQPLDSHHCSADLNTLKLRGP